jgi:acetylornithine deacetylase/succinyl-diaminopimelate desuccinylase-like protein
MPDDQSQARQTTVETGFALIWRPFPACLGAVMTAAALSPTLELACELINRPSVTPLDEGCQQLMSERLAACGFAIEPMHIEDVENFWAIRGNSGPVPYRRGTHRASAGLAEPTVRSAHR